MGDLPDDVRTHYMMSGGNEILKKLLLTDNSLNKPMLTISGN